MTTLTNPVTPQNIVDRFKDFVTDTANSTIIWGTNNKPFSEMPDNTYAGTTSGVSINATGATIGTTGNTITAATIRSVLETETALYTNIRRQRALLNVIGVAGEANIGSRPVAGIIFDNTQVAHLNTGNRSNLGAISSTNVESGDIINATNLENYFQRIATAYNNIRTTAITNQIDVCHASCHGNCHGSRSRR
jgi:hypothetical protein